MTLISKFEESFPSEMADLFENHFQRFHTTKGLVRQLLGTRVICDITYLQTENLHIPTISDPIKDTI